jgi:hypothetical protein
MGGSINSQRLPSAETKLPSAARSKTRWQLPSFFLANMHCIQYKVDELSSVTELNRTDIACITESWLNGNVENGTVDINGFVCYRRDRADGRRGGGVACHVDSTWPCTRLYEVESPNLETLWLLLRRSTMPRCVSHIAVGVVYHPPGEDNLPMLNHKIDCLDYIRRTHPSAGIFVRGDFILFLTVKKQSKRCLMPSYLYTLLFDVKTTNHGSQ